MKRGVRAERMLGCTRTNLVGLLEVAFYNYGRMIARAPILVIILCLALVAVCSVGLTKFRQETLSTKLWTPEDSEILRVQEWMEKSFSSDVRLNMAIYEADNVLEKRALLEMLRVHEVLASTTATEATWNTACVKVPVLPTFVYGRRRRNVIPRDRHTRQVDGLDFSQFFTRDNFCELLESLREVCLESGLLDVFGYNREFLTSLTQQQILREINEAERSVVSGFPLNVSQYLADVERDVEGNIVRAGAASHIWFTRVNISTTDAGNSVAGAGAGNQGDGNTQQWEQQMITSLLDPTNRMPNVSFYLMSASSFGTVSGDNIRGDLQFLSLGFCVVFVFVVAMLGRRNQVEARPLLSLLGLACVGLAVDVSYGLCSAFEIPYGPVNSILPFLLLGLGIDDMFVILEAWRSLGPEEERRKLEDRIGLALGRAGVAITVTSLTDFLAFAVGSTTVLPALRSFCIYSAVGIISVYFFQATFFVAWLTLDQRRLENGRHSFFWCWKMSPNWSPSACSQHEICHEFFSRFYARLLFLSPVRIAVLLLTGAVFCVSVWGAANLRQEFDPIWFLPQDSYLYEYFQKQREYFPSLEEPGSVYFSNISIVKELPKIQELTRRLRSSEYVAEVDSWVEKFAEYWDSPIEQEEENLFPDRLSKFLYSVSGSQYRTRNFRFSSALSCREEAPPVDAFSIDFSHELLMSSQEKVKAMEAVRTIVRGVNISGETRVWARAYANWETNKVIEEELYRNLGVAIMVVALATLVLLTSVVASIMVVVCVLLTLVDVAALMHWWGLTIDTVSCVDLVLAVGLCVDYAAHVAHTFLSHRGTRVQRAADTLATIGPPVLSGGFSTFLAFVFLANSSSHVFLSFFKIFFGVCVYGLYHGLVFLPVLLSLVGPASHHAAAAAAAANAVSPHPGPPNTPAPTRPLPAYAVKQNNKSFFEKVISGNGVPESANSSRAAAWQAERGVFTVEGLQGGMSGQGR